MKETDQFHDPAALTLGKELLHLVQMWKWKEKSVHPAHIQWNNWPMMKKNLITNSMEHILPEKPTGLQLVWEFPTFHRNWRSITVFVRAHHLPLFLTSTYQDVTTMIYRDCVTFGDSAVTIMTRLWAGWPRSHVLDSERPNGFVSSPKHPNQLCPPHSSFPFNE